MANHVRQQIREAVALRLTGLETTGTRVYQSRLIVLQADELPALLIATNSESIELIDIGINALQQRTLTISVTALVKAIDSLDDMLDTVIKEVEQAMSASLTANTLDGLVKDLVLTGIEIEMNSDMEVPAGQAVLTFNANYYTRAQAPDVSI
jgi:hypothetical protein